MSSNYASTNLAEPHTLVGMLQRGLGEGVLASRAVSAEEVRSLVHQCLLRDPRWDRQLECREGYYAALLMRSPYPTAGVQDILRTAEAPGLAISVLGELFVRGDTTAEAILRDEVRSENRSQDALGALLDRRARRPMPGLDQRICERYPDSASLHDALHWLVEEGEPWDSWCRSNPRINRFVRECRAEDAARPQPLSVDCYADCSVERALAVVTPRNSRALTQAVRRNAAASDAAILTPHLDPSDPLRCLLALWGLSALADPATYPALRNLAESYPDLLPFSLRGPLRRALIALPGTVTLGAGRCWFDRDEWWFRWLGAQILARHATAEDLHRLAEAVHPALAAGDMYRLCSVAEALGHVGARASIPALDRIYREARYSCARHDAVEAIAAIAPDHFTERFAYPCLWDSEELIRRQASQLANPSRPEVYERLRELAADPYEDNTIRNAAHHHSVFLSRDPSGPDAPPHPDSQHHQRLEHKDRR